MPDTQPTRTSYDELAALYLRGRDVPCPGCGYNRRDGMAAGCPECGHRFALEPILPAPRQVSHGMAVGLGLLVLINAVMIVPGQTISTIRIYGNMGAGIQTWMVTNLLLSAGFLIAGVLAVTSLIRVNSRRDNAVRPLLWAGIVLLVSLLPAAVSTVIELF